MIRTTLIFLTILISGCATIDRSPGSPYHFTEIEYFLELAFGTQFKGDTAYLSRWDKPIFISLQGNPSQNDKAAAQTVVDDINKILGTQKVILSDVNPNLTIHFVEPQEFKEIIPDILSSHWVYFKVKRDAYGSIESGVILISSQILTQARRDTYIRSMITRTLGLMNVSNRFSNSLFTSEGRAVQTAYNEYDTELIKMLYREDIKSGFTITQVEEVLANAKR